MLIKARSGMRAVLEERVFEKSREKCMSDHDMGMCCISEGAKTSTRMPAGYLAHSWGLEPCCIAFPRLDGHFCCRFMHWCMTTYVQMNAVGERFIHPPIKSWNRDPWNHGTKRYWTASAIPHSTLHLPSSPPCYTHLTREAK